jgi:hypothetical protein
VVDGAAAEGGGSRAYHAHAVGGAGFGADRVRSHGSADRTPERNGERGSRTRAHGASGATAQVEGL